MSSPEHSGRKRSFISNRRNHISVPDNNPSFLINYDDHSNTPASAHKITPPVLIRARNSFNGDLPMFTAARRASITAVEDLVNCMLCSDRLKSPKMLGCQHTFCLPCLEVELLNSKQNSFLSCPTCKTKHELIPKQTLNNLPSNLHIDSLLKVLKEPFTAILPVVEADNQLRCEKCETVSMKNIQVCSHCKQNFCTICWNSHMDELSKQVALLDVQLKSAIEKMNHKMDGYKDRFESINHHINAFFDDKMAALRAQQNKLLGESQGILNQGIVSHDEMIDKIKQLKNLIGDSVISSSGNRVQVFLKLHTETSNIFNEIQQWGERRVFFNQEHGQIELLSEEFADEEDSSDGDKTSINHPLNALENPESLCAYYKRKCFKPKLIWTKCQRPSGVGIAPWVHDETGQYLLYIAGSDSRIIFGINKTNGQIVQKISHDDMVCPHGIAFSNERKEIFVSDKWKHCIFVFSQVGKFLRLLGNKGEMEGYLRSPEGLAVGLNNSIYVCDTGNDRIQCLNVVDGRMMSQFGLIRKDQLSKLSQSADLNSPTGIALHNDLIIVLDSGNRRVKTFNKRGEKLSEFGQMGALKGQFKYPEVIAVDQLGFILVGDGGNARIQVFNPHGNFVTTLGTRGKAPGQFNWISGICVTKDLEIIVTDYKNHAVQIFD